LFRILFVKINFIAGILSEKHNAKKVTDIIFWAMELKPREKYSALSPNTSRY
jgi:hypothetical protein